MAGRIVNELSSVFARYWNSDSVWPLSVFADEKAMRDLPAPQTAGITPDVVDLLGQGAPGIEFAGGKLSLVAGGAYAVADPPSKVRNLDEDHLHATSVTSHLRGALATARTSVFISSPYLIPREKGMDALLNLTNRKVRVSILTNSMAANDSVYAHAGYARYRRKMLEAGVELYEISPALIGGNGRSKLRSGPALSHGRLHAKTVVIDQQTVFIGSMNLDPRSADKNTELGIFIDSPELALQVLAVLDANRLGVALALGWFLLRSIHPRSSRWRGVEAWPASAAPCAHSARVRSPRPGLLQMISLGRSLRGLWDA